MLRISGDPESGRSGNDFIPVNSERSKDEDKKDEVLSGGESRS
jgi:hypothetical protein